MDFACTAARLVVEVDGGSHDGRERHDAQRDGDLAALGWRVLRVAEEEVFRDLDGAVGRVMEAADLAVLVRITR